MVCNTILFQGCLQAKVQGQSLYGGGYSMHVFIHTHTSLQRVYRPAAHVVIIIPYTCCMDDPEVAVPKITVGIAMSCKVFRHSLFKSQENL